MENVQQKLAALDKKSDALIQEGKYLESLDAMEEALHLRRNYFGETSDEYYKTSEKLCELCNMLSMIFLQKEKFEATLEFLRKAEQLARNSLELKGVTYNNMACYYRRIGKLKIALKYLEDALAIEIKLDKTKALADTHLNICAVYSQLEKHDIAMNHIMKSIILLQDELLIYSMTPEDQNNSIQDESERKKQLEDRIAVLAIAYHNLGVEHEYLKQYEEAILTYRKAVNFARNHLGEHSQVAKNLQNVLDTAAAQIEDIRNQAKQKKFAKATFSKSRTTTANRFKQASNVYSREGPRTQAKRFSYGGDNESPQKNENERLVDSYSKPIPEEHYSGYSGTSPDKYDGTGKSSRREQPSESYNVDSSERHDQKGKNAGHHDQNAIEESMKEETFNNNSNADSKEINASNL